ncbi:hypothetical protein PVAND_011150 [Polypedilum vanderplanki]|uniref:Tr-type G domain-containing protein n=1 Tax=Polypedilum vanderplanki TaxID=319348 RepID=A0A9J6CIF2_POLVA|nr:hypothetical protein PVAND_011150 [Polypedilum vanderplanki]
MDFLSLFDPSSDTQTDETDTETFSSSDTDSIDKYLPDTAKLPPEPEFGNIEYKLKLINPSKQRLDHLVTQMKWRLQEGDGECFYQIGVSDNGTLHGLTVEDMNLSLNTLKLMASQLCATTAVLKRKILSTGKSCCEVLVRKFSDIRNIEEIRISLMGSVDSGKSSLIGVLTQGELDNGRGKARLNMFRHFHEIKTGRTSCVSHEVLGFDENGNVINYKNKYNEMMTAEKIGERSKKLISFMDLAGHRRYMKTTIQAVSGYAPHFISLVIASGSLNQMTIENLQIIKAFKIPFFVILTKIDMISPHEAGTIKQLFQLLNDVDKNKTPLVIESTNDFRLLEDGNSKNYIPIFCVSNVTGAGLNLVQDYLYKLSPNINENERKRLEKESPEFHIDEIFRVQGVGTIFGGLNLKGIIYENMRVKVGPGPNGEFYKGVIKSIHRNKFPCKEIRPNQSASICLSLNDETPILRSGMVLIADNDECELSSVFFQATVAVIQHSSSKGIKKGFQTTVHMGSIRQTAVFEGIFARDSLKANETGSCLFRFLVRPEFVKVGMSLLFRDGKTKGVGVVTQIFPLHDA